MEAWISQHWFDLLQTVGIIGGFAFTAQSIRREGKARQIANMIAINERHQSLWKELYKRPELARITEEAASLDAKPLTDEERLFVMFLILHLGVVYRATEAKMFVKLDGLRKDIKSFFSFPIPKAVWEKIKSSQDRDFVAFVDGCLN